MKFQKMLITTSAIVALAVPAVANASGHVKVTSKHPAKVHTKTATKSVQPYIYISGPATQAPALSADEQCAAMNQDLTDHALDAIDCSTGSSDSTDA